jgi:hypothetical protein
LKYLVDLVVLTGFDNAKFDLKFRVKTFTFEDITMSNVTKKRYLTVGCGLVLAAVLSWIPIATAGDERSGSKPPSSQTPVLNALLFGPNAYTVQGSKSQSGQRMLNLGIGNGKSLAYKEGQQITVNDGKSSLNIAIVGDQVQVGDKYWCSSSNTACIVHAIRKQMKGLSQEDAANGLAVVKQSLSGMKFGGQIGQVFYALATMPVTKEDHDDGHDD